ncbi:MAG: hypothetical protein OEW21_17160 [Betaproteobacteria bacterium]|nr:hypothetical protein [Betaproteobacteria bacterium]
MPPRGSRLACSLRTQDGCNGSYDVTPGEQPGSIAKVDPVSWDKPPQKPVQQGAFSVIGEMGMTGQVILVNQYQWAALQQAKLEQFFYGAILWGKSPFKVIEDAETIVKRGK